MSIIYQKEHYTVVKWTKKGAIIKKTNGSNSEIELDFSKLKKRSCL